jgi:rhodanese-related sulfurtransferase
MRVNYILICCLLIILFLVIYYNFQKSLEISPLDARQNIKNEKYDYIIDVRTQKEWDEDHLENTISIPIGNLVSELPQKIPDRNARLLFVCKKGVRASGVVTIANKLGYHNVQAMIGNYRELIN